MMVAPLPAAAMVARVLELGAAAERLLAPTSARGRPPNAG